MYVSYMHTVHVHISLHILLGDGVVPEQFDEWISISAEGNILEATNLAVNGNYMYMYYIL